MKLEGKSTIYLAGRLSKITRKIIATIRNLVARITGNNKE